MKQTAEERRLLDHHNKKANWRLFGPFLSERQWGTVREDRNNPADPWKAISYEEAIDTAYEWGDDGLGGFCDRFGNYCFSFAFWNGKDAVIKERLFGLSNAEGNHGEDVKELYYYLDSAPTHSYWKTLYKYPHSAFPYDELRKKNAEKTLEEGEYELIDTGIFEGDHYFDIFFEYCKVDEKDLLIKVTIENRADIDAPLWVLPQIWVKNGVGPLRPDGDHAIAIDETYSLYTENGERLFTDYETGKKGAFQKHLIEKTPCTQKEGTKAGILYLFDIKQVAHLRLRFSDKKLKDPFKDFDALFEKRQKETDEYYASVQNQKLSKELLKVQRQAFAGMLLSQQLYSLSIPEWKKKEGEQRNLDWDHLIAFDVFSMPDKWEYPYFCSWDLAFHCIPLVMVDPDFAKRQLTLMTREWYMHPSGQLPAYEWKFSDVNPPVHAWATWRIFKIDAKKWGKEDRPFLEGIFHKLLLNFTWWINKKDIEGKNLFQGGFLGMDNISVFDRSRDLPTGGHIDQSDGSAWMSFFCILMLKISFHLAREEPVYQDMSTKFFEHFLRIASAMGARGNAHSLWNEEEGFFYDVLHLPDGKYEPLKVRSLVGLLPLLAVETLEADLLDNLPVFKRRMEWFLSKRQDIACNVACLYEPGVENRRLLSILTKEQLTKVLTYMLDEEEFLSPHGIRSVSKYHEKNPYVFQADGHRYEVKYVPGESNNRMFGGNSNWRGPIWMPINFLLIESLQKYHHYFGEEFKVEFPTRSGNYLNLWQVSEELSKRLMSLFLEDEKGHKPFFGGDQKLQEDPHFSDYYLFNEYYHGDHGKGLGASHQTGWTGLIAKLIQQSGELFS